MLIKNVSRRMDSRRVKSHIYIGPDKDHLQLAGALVLDIGEWLTFGAALLLGARAMHGTLHVVCSGDYEVVTPQMKGASHEHEEDETR